MLVGLIRKIPLVKRVIWLREARYDGTTKGLPLNEFVDERIDAKTILNPEIHYVQQRMMNASS
jgi:hypothetical protein